MKDTLVTGWNSRAASRFKDNILRSQKQFNYLCPNHNQLDITNLKALSSFFYLYKPLTVINFAAISDLADCEKERGNLTGSVWKTNVVGVDNLVKVCNKFQAHFIQISTASVFSGRKSRPGPYKENDPPEVNNFFLSWYGISKRTAEEIVLSKSQSYTIVRLSSVARSKNNSKLDLLQRILDQYLKNSLLPQFYDQSLTLTDLTDLSKTLLNIKKSKVKGIVHISSPDLSSPYKIAVQLCTKTQESISTIPSCSINDYFQKNPLSNRFFPQFWGLSSHETEKKLNIRFNAIDQIINKFICDLSSD